jgi:hypothetical protein
MGELPSLRSIKSVTGLGTFWSVHWDVRHRHTPALTYLIDMYSILLHVRFEDEPSISVLTDMATRYIKQRLGNWKVSKKVEGFQLRLAHFISRPVLPFEFQTPILQLNLNRGELEKSLFLSLSLSYIHWLGNDLWTKPCCIWLWLVLKRGFHMEET